MKSAKTARALRLPADYAVWLTALKARVRSAQLRAAARVNRELISLYWDLGRSILRQQRDEGWGAKVVERLAADLKAEFPEMAGFSRANLLFMRSFAEAWLDPATVQQPVALLNTSPSPAGPPIVLQPVRQLAPGGASPQSAAIVQQPVGQPDAGPPEPMASLPWGHNLLLLHKLQSPADRRWYAQAAVANGWSRSVLAVQIEQRAHRRAGKAVTNFAATLPPPHPYSISPRLQSPLSPSTNAAGQNGLARRPLPLNICLVSRDTSSPEPTCSFGVCRRTARARPISANGARNLHKDGLPQHSRSSRCGDRLDSKRPPDKDRRPSTLT